MNKKSYFSTIAAIFLLTIGVAGFGVGLFDTFPTLAFQIFMIVASGGAIFGTTMILVDNVKYWSRR
ncbi:MAG TPA: hypothetical protein ENI23_00550 [bacterium]|nr:hypothetical protein [bacterium]